MRLLAPHLTDRNVGELLAEATHKTKASIELIVARRFPQADVAARIVPIPAQVSANTSSEHAPGHVVSSQLQPPASIQEPSASVPEHAEALLATPALAPEPRPRVKPLTPERFGIHFTFGQSAHDKLRRAQELLGFQVSSGDLAAVFERALDALIPQLEKARFKATNRPRAAKPATPESRNIPAHVQRAVWKRDGGRCTFVGEHGRRCEERRGLHFDHILPVARGGESSISNVRLLCPTLNQLEAERRFGHAFMRGKRQAAS